MHPIWEFITYNDMKRLLLTMLVMLGAVCGYGQTAGSGSVNGGSGFVVPELPEKATAADCASLRARIPECLDWLMTHDMDSKDKAEQLTRYQIYKFILDWCGRTDELMFTLEDSFVSYKTEFLLLYFLGGWASYYVTTNDKDGLNGRMAGVAAVMDYYKSYPKALKKDKKKITELIKMDEQGTLRQYIEDNMVKK